MKMAAFSAICPVEIGDKVTFMNTESMAAGKLEPGTVFVFSGAPVQHTITDIATIHYVKTGKVIFTYELDNSGEYVHIQFQDK